MRQQSNQRGTARTSLGALAFALLLLVFASPALAGPPTHLRTPALDLVGAAPDPGPTHPAAPFNQACGTAVDSRGDVYVASAGNDVIDIFNAAHEYLTSIPNANNPCGLAVDSNGKLFVSEQATGNVVCYTPDVYPLTGSPVYTPCGAPVDSSGLAKGISVDPVDDRLYVAAGNRVAIYKSDGSFEVNTGEPTLTEATGVAAYTYASGDRYLFVADADGGDPDKVYVLSGGSVALLELLRTIDGSDADAFKADETPNSGLGFGVSGAALAVDRANGHVLVYDAEHEVVDEFEAAGSYVTQIAEEGFEDAEPSGIAVFPQRNEIQSLEVSATSAGSFSLGFKGQWTGPIAWNAPPVDPGTPEVIDSVQEALEALPTIGVGNVVVGGSAADAADGRQSIMFIGALAGRDSEQLAIDDSQMTIGSATVTAEVQGSGPGRTYVGAGAGTSARVLAFAPLADADRLLEEPQSLTLKEPSSVAVDAYGNRYVSSGASILVYPSEGDVPLTEIVDPGAPYDIAVDSECNVYALDRNANLGFQQESVVYFRPSACPPKAGTEYSAPTLVAKNGPPHFVETKSLTAIGINPANDHVFVNQELSPQTIEIDSAANGSAIVDPDWGDGLVAGVWDLDVWGATGNVYVSLRSQPRVLVLNPEGTRVIATITGVGSPKGRFRPRAVVAVDQANGHAVVFRNVRRVAEEYDASGAFVAEFGKFSDVSNVPQRIAIDNSCELGQPPLEGAACDAFDPSHGNVYVAFNDPAPGAFDLTAFGPLSYGEVPQVATGTASNVGGGVATLNGTVDPRGTEVAECRFEHLTDGQYKANGETFAGAELSPCLESSEEIGQGKGTVPVHADVAGLDPEARYRFRLVAENAFGPAPPGEAGLFGPPEVSERAAQPISYREATLRATVDPSGLATEYRFEYGTTEAYGQSTPPAQLPAGAGPSDVAVPVFGLAEGATYHFRVVAENDAKSVEGIDQTLTTLRRPPIEPCPNEEYRMGRSSNLPDCRAYELVTPAETRGLTPQDIAFTAPQFNHWLVARDGDRAGDRLSFFTDGTLPGFDGSGILDGYRAERALGAHPSEGWSSALFTPSYAEAAFDVNGGLSPQGMSSDQGYSLWHVKDPRGGVLPQGSYLRTSNGFEPLGRGSLGTDLNALGHYVGPGGAHVIFSSEARLEPAAAPVPTRAIYDRAAGESTSEVISVKPDGTPFGATEDATFLGATDDGTAVAFAVGGALYLNRGGNTVQIAEAPNTFAGVGEEGLRVFYVDASVGGPTPAPAGLWACDVAAGGCAGPEKDHDPVQIAPQGNFVNVSADGSRVYFASTQDLDGPGEALSGSDNLYLWEEGTEATRFVAFLDPEDLSAGGFLGITDNLSRWTDAIDGSRALSPTRSTADGAVFAFQSHAQLTSYDNTEAGAGACGDPEAAGEACIEVYRYDAEAPPGSQVVCLSCDFTGEPPTGDSLLQDFRTDATTLGSSVIPNVTAVGTTVFFQSGAALLPEDANSVQDVYEWQAQEVGGCDREGGCLALISSGQGDKDSFLYSMTPDGSDVFFSTLEKLHGADITGSPSIYDARVEGGIPDPPAPAPCQGDACQGQGSTPPNLPAPASTGGAGNGNVREGTPKPRCPKGKRRVRRKGKVRCVKPRAKKHGKRSLGRRANHNRRAGR